MSNVKYNFSDDGTTAYGELPSGEVFVLDADMEPSSHYDENLADYACLFIEQLCHTKGTWAGKPFELIDWQEQIVRDLFGVIKENGYRQFNTAYVEIPKKQGKSELAAAIALLLTCGDNEERAEVYGCAADRNQAKIVFDVAVDMVRFCPALSKRVKILESQKRLEYLPTHSFYQVLSADVANKHGFNTHGVIFDELHTQPNRKLFDVMTKGSGDARMQPLFFLITTAGNDTHSICYEQHEKALDIMNGYATARQNGWMSANDIRELENLDRIPEESGGDLYLINGNMDNAPVDTGKYKKSWSVKNVHEDAESIDLVVHSRNRYQIAHLLEHGRVKRRNGSESYRADYHSNRTAGSRIYLSLEQL